MRRLVVAMLGLSLVPSLAGVLAAPIALSGGDAREFGQGAQQMSVCDPEILVEVVHAWDTGTSTFVVESLDVSGIDTGACAGRLIEVAVWDGQGAQVDVCGSPSACSADGSAFVVTVASATSAALPVIPGLSPDDIVTVTVTTS